MRLVIVLMVQVVFLTSTFAQRGKAGYIGFNMGPSLPTADFRNAANDPEAGFAKLGIVISPVSFIYLFSYQFGISAQFSRRSYHIDDVAFSKYYGDNVKTEDPYVLTPLSIGPVLSFYLFYGKAHLDINPQISFTRASIPRQQRGSDTRFEANEFIVSYGLGTGLRYNLDYDFAINVRVDYFYTNPSFNQPLYGDVNQKMSGVDLSLGIGYRIQ